MKTALFTLLVCMSFGLRGEIRCELPGNAAVDLRKVVPIEVGMSRALVERLLGETKADPFVMDAVLVGREWAIPGGGRFIAVFRNNTLIHYYGTQVDAEGKTMIVNEVSGDWIERQIFIDHLKRLEMEKLNE